MQKFFVMLLIFILALFIIAIFKICSNRKRHYKKYFKPKFYVNKTQIANKPSGVIGEIATAAATAKVCIADGRKFALMKNLYIPARSGYTEIDVLLLHQSGIYIIESKNLFGKIFGTSKDTLWHQIVNANTEHSLHNPILQNAGHIRAIKYYLKMYREDIPFVSVIVFSDRCKLNMSKKDLALNNIMYYNEIGTKLLNIIKNRKTLYNTKQLQKFCEMLDNCANVNDKVKKAHNNYIKDAYKK